MGDTDWRLIRGAVTAEGRRRRASNRTLAPAELTAAGITFTMHNDGAHLIVADEWNFWPGTGRFSHRGPPHIDGRGIRNLIARIKP